MALLTNTQRREIWMEYQEEISRLLETINISKSELKAAVDAIDQWIEDNSASFNQAIPLPARTELTARQKIRIFAAILKKRFEVS